MIEYSFNKKDTKIRIKEMTLSQIKPFLIGGVVALIFDIYFMTVGLIYSDSDVLLSFGYPLLCVFVFLFLYSLCIYVKLKKAILMQVNRTAKYDIVNYILEKNNDIYKKICLQTKEEIEFTKEDIEMVYIMKNIVVIRLKTKALLDFPKEQRIVNLFK